MNKLSLKMKLVFGFGILMLLLAICGAVGYNSAATEDKLSDDVENQVEKKDDVLLAADGINLQLVGLRGFLLTGKEDHLKPLMQGRQQFKDSTDDLGKRLQTEDGKRAFAQIQQKYAEYIAIMDESAQLRRDGKVDDAINRIFNPEVSARRADLLGQISAISKTVEELKKAAREQQAATEARTQTLMMGLVVVGLAAGLLVAWLIAHSIMRSISEMKNVVQEIAENNLTVNDLEVATEDELGQASLSVNRMKNNLREIIQSIAGTAEHVASASEEISSSATLQAQGAETQKDQAAQVATAMQEMSSTVLQVSENSNRAAEASRQAAETAREGGNIVEETLVKMRAIAETVQGSAKKVEELGKSSDQIGRIAGVIDDIADQTNLLALNAAIEAARAGEQGRGFAVVADEVRKLAERTTTATKEIAQMIKNIQDETKIAVVAMEAGTKQVEEGVTSTTLAGASLKQIIHMSEQVGEMITHIATAATEQSSASEEVNNNMEQIAKLVRESADGAKQSAQACTDLSGLALDLQKMVGNFKVGNDGRHHRDETKGGARKFHEVKAPKTIAAAAH